MSSSVRLDLQLEEPGDDTLSDQVFDIVRNTLQPDFELPLENAVQKIGALLPESKPYSSEVGTFLENCYGMADQIPHSHPSMTKLVTLVYSTLNFVWQSQSDKTGDKAQDNPYQKLVETLRDWWNSRSNSAKKPQAVLMLTSRAGSSPAEDPEKYVNFQAFTAHLYERGMIKGSHLAVWTIQDALDGANTLPEQKRNAYVKAASNWILLNGEAVYAEVAGGESVSTKKWSHWHDRIDEVADGTWNKRPCAYDDDTVLLAGRASVSMDAIERRKNG
ncbi:hypothetical protein Q7P36_003678 [Cladosporium allicinum]